MIGNIARRLGLRPTVSAGVVDGWRLPDPAASGPPFDIAPLGGAATCLIDGNCRLQPANSSFTLDLAIMAGANWRAASEFGTVQRKVNELGTVVSTVRTPDGPIYHRVAAGVVDARAVAIVEVENQSGVAVAIAAVVRPFMLDGRGYLGQTDVSGDGIVVDRGVVDGGSGVRFATVPASLAAAIGADGDLMSAMPAPDAGARPATAKCRSGAAQATAVWPLPHTATVRYVLELEGPTARSSAVPAIADVERGWSIHLGRAARIEVDGEPVVAGVGRAARSLMTRWPQASWLNPAITALAEAGLGSEAVRFFDDLDEDALLAAVSRWFQLGGSLDVLHEVLPAVAKAAHRAVGAGPLVGPPWLAESMQALAAGVRAIEQPDVADRIASLPIEVSGGGSIEMSEAFRSLRELNQTVGSTPAAQYQIAEAARAVMLSRRLVLDDRGEQLRVLPWMPPAWRGKPIDVLGLPTAHGRLSFGLRWHGPRAAFLWEFEAAADAPVRLSVPGVDPSFETTEATGETLLADPGWETP